MFIDTTTLLKALGRGAVSGFAGALVWVVASRYLFGQPEPQQATLVAVTIAVVVAVMTAAGELK
jgi:hypothetical protein